MTSAIVLAIVIPSEQLNITRCERGICNLERMSNPFQIPQPEDQASG